jgi:hypothetical protein
MSGSPTRVNASESGQTASSSTSIPASLVGQIVNHTHTGTGSPSLGTPNLPDGVTQCAGCEAEIDSTQGGTVVAFG